MVRIEISKGEITTTLHNGIITSIQYQGIEFFHGGAKPEDEKTKKDKNPKAWKRSEIIMFPIVGPSEKYKIMMGKTSFLQDQHGMARHKPFGKCEVTSTKAGKPMITFTQTHNQEDEVINEKYSGKEGQPTMLTYPSYSLRKSIFPRKHSVKVKFEIRNDSTNRNLKYMFGWHPAFRTQGKSKHDVMSILDSGGKVTRVSLEEVAQESSTNGAFIPPGLKPREIEYANLKTKRGFRMYVRNVKAYDEQSEINHLMLWTPHIKSGMFCVEPITHLPLSRTVTQSDSKRYASLKRGQTADYWFEIKPIIL